jgi:acyl carrier protein
VHERVRALMQELFGLGEDRLLPDARLYEELGLDSIDAIDLIARVSEITGRKIDGERFRSVRTVRDLDDAIDSVLEGEG